MPSLRMTKLSEGVADLEKQIDVLQERLQLEREKGKNDALRFIRSKTNYLTMGVANIVDVELKKSDIKDTGDLNHRIAGAVYEHLIKGTF